jgi:nicotinate-nucleotide adenylyltransferase
VNERSIVGVLGGTFDPVHLGHLEVASWLRSVLQLPRLLLLPSAVPPHKRPSDLTPAVHREAMLRLAVADYPDLEISTLELETGDVCYTIDTLRRMREGAASCEPVFVVGTDALLDLPTWRDFEKLLREFDLIAVSRVGRTLEAIRPRLHAAVAQRIRPLADTESVARELRSSASRGRIFVVRRDPIPISSSEIRRRAAAGGGLDDLVPPAVARYICRNGLYRKEG